MRADAGDDVVQPGLWLEPAEGRRAGQRIEPGGSLAAGDLALP